MSRSSLLRKTSFSRKKGNIKSYLLTWLLLWGDHKKTNHMTGATKSWCTDLGNPDHPDDKWIKGGQILNGWITENKTKHKKCQPAAGDRPDLIQTESVPDSWLAHPTIENWRTYPCVQSSKLRNKSVKIVNGNRNSFKQLSVMHWNLGARHWTNKLVELEALVTGKNPDLLFVSESNLWADVSHEDMHIPGHKIYLPAAMASMKHARIVLVARAELNVHVLTDYLDSETATIWIKVGSSKNNSLVIGGVYREHLQLGKGESNDTWAVRQRKQQWRWRRIMKNWKKACRNSNCVVIGDFNLDYLKWGSPDSAHETMVEEFQDNIETDGFTQIISGHTRAWETVSLTTSGPTAGAVSSDT